MEIWIWEFFPRSEISSEGFTLNPKAPGDLVLLRLLAVSLKVPGQAYPEGGLENCRNLGSAWQKPPKKKAKPTTKASVLLLPRLQPRRPPEALGARRNERPKEGSQGPQRPSEAPPAAGAVFYSRV